MNEHIVRARSDLLFTEPFFGTLLLGLALIHDSKRIKTMATDGKSLFYNEKFVAGLFKLLLVGVLVHEGFTRYVTAPSKAQWARS